MGPNRQIGREQPDELVTEIVSAVAEDADPLDLPPLAASIDLEAAQTLLDDADADLRISFEYAGRTVLLHGDGTVEVRERGLCR